MTRRLEEIVAADPVPTKHLSPNVRDLAPSATLAINERSAELCRQGRDIVRFGFGQSPFPVSAPVVEALRENAHRKDYLPVKGLLELREAVSEYFLRVHRIKRSAHNVLIGPGSKELMFLLQFVYCGDVVIPTPSWVSYAPQAHILGRQMRRLPTYLANNWLLQPEELERLCGADLDRPRLLILNYPHNPTGQTYEAAQLQALADVARTYRVLVLSDEIYGDFHHEGKHYSMAEFYPERTIVSSGLSKWCGAGGWRLGTFSFPDSLHALLDSMAAVAAETFSSTSAPIQYAAVRAFRGGPEIEHYVVSCRRILKSLGRYCARRLKEAGLRTADPRGAFYLFPSFSPFEKELNRKGVTTGGMLCERILQETGVVLLPAFCFGQPEPDLSVRLAYVDFDGSRALEEADRIPANEPLTDGFLKTHCSKVTAGIERISAWISRT